MTLYTCTTCHRINAPKKGETELLGCWTCGGAVVVVSDVLPFTNYCECDSPMVRYDGEAEYCGICELNFEPVRTGPDA